MLKLLCSGAKIERDTGLQQLKKYLETEDEKNVTDLQNDLLRLFFDDAASWETKHGSLQAVKAILNYKQCSDEFCASVVERSLHLLDDQEFRVRISAGEVMGVLCEKCGSDVYSKSQSIILNGIQSNLERQSMTEGETEGNDEREKLVEKLAGPSQKPGEKPRRNSADAAQIFHDTAGWKSLETWMKCLQNVIEGCGYGFNPFVNQELLDLIFSALAHTNRFVRETGYYVCSSLVGCGLKKDEKGPTEGAALAEENAIYRHGNHFAEYLGKGLSDNWSQVRLAGSVATRRFLMSLPSEAAREKFYPVLLPRMCLNRYYVAEGVRIYSQETWKQITHGAGKSLVEKYVSNVVDFYIEQTEADNHAVREAACTCIAELGSKVEKSVVSPSIPKLLDALLVCFNDDSWPVRDAACIACGNFIQCFPEESRSTIPALYSLFFNNLHDNIASVRQGAALALSHVVQAYGEESHETIFSKIKEGLDGLEKQPACAEKYSDLEKGPATYGVAKRLRDNDMDLHTDKQMYSCGSLAPKMGRGHRGGGCMDHMFRKPSEPWELADGCVHLLAELSQQKPLVQKVSQILPQLAKAASYRHYTQHVVFLESVCKQLPNIAKGLGKRPFKTYIESFFDAIFYSVSCDNALTSNAASQCLSQLSSFLGPSILRGRVEQYNPKYLDQLDGGTFMAPV